MKKSDLFHTFKQEADALVIRTKIESGSLADILKSNRGDQVTSSGGLAIIAVLVIAAVITWIAVFQPKFFTKLGDTIMDMFDS